MAEADSETADPSGCGVRIADPIPSCIFAAPDCSEGRARTGAVDGYTFLLIFWKSWTLHPFPDQPQQRPAECAARVGDPDCHPEATAAGPKVESLIIGRSHVGRPAIESIENMMDYAASRHDVSRKQRAVHHSFER
jgi:hypothetical protein